MKVMVCDKRLGNHKRFKITIEAVVPKKEMLSISDICGSCFPEIDRCLNRIFNELRKAKQ